MIHRWFSRLNRVQQSRSFKVAASIVVLALGVLAFVSYSVAAAKVANQRLALLQSGVERAPADAPASMDPAQRRAEDAIAATQRVLEGVISAQKSTLSVGLGAALVTGLALLVIWLGLGLTYVGLLGACAAAIGLSAVFGSARQWAPLAVGVVALAAAFTAIIRVLGIALSGSTPVMSVARNVLTEAVRLRVSLVFIVLLIFALAAMPLLLQENQPLRYRVQSFLQFATTASFWIIAVLVVLFSVSTVAVEQRDKQIWQTITKPVAAWQYLLGKWVGVGALSLSLLGVSCTGVFLFTEYLRRQPALKETTAFVPQDDRVVAEDRLLLETQVLAARRSVHPSPPELDPKAFDAEVADRVKKELERQSLGTDAEAYRTNALSLERKIRADLTKGVEIAYRTLPPAGQQYFMFEGLRAARDSNRPLTLRYKIQSGANSPDQIYRVTFVFPAAQAAQEQEAPLDQFVTLQLLPTVVDEEGLVLVQIINGRIADDEGTMAIPNPASITFPPDGLQLSYSAGSFQANFVRLVGVLWVKLLVLSMLGIFTSTFMSFSVASLVSFSVFLMAEGARFLLSSLEQFGTEDFQGNTQWFRLFVSKVSGVVGNLFRVYADLRPTARLVDGEYLSWWDFTGGAGALLVGTFVLYAAGVLIFKRRELAIYSGQ